ncbi:MAG TPA: hypothetical protein PLT82_02575 [Candidatus Hydrogenedens sp.]|nr:hypothetical protein [Candidatus Hydrogenedens sp.]HPP57997.1 hypothetical protein [Candidatus Hydrogenedens sp.]
MQIKQNKLCAGSIIFVGFILISFFGYSKEQRENIKETLQTAKQIAVSITVVPDEFVIAVSPVRQTLQIIHSTARLAGALISEVQNENYRKDLQKAIGEIKVTDSYRDAILNALKNKVSGEIIEVPPLGSTAKYKTDREAVQERLKQLRAKNFDVLIDMKITCGIYGPEGEMFFRWNGKLYDLHNEKLLWRNEMVFSPSVDFRINQDFKTYFNPFKSNMFSPRLTLSKNALSRWTDNHGENFKNSKEYGIQLAVSSLLGELQLEDSKEVYFAKGISELYRRKWKRAVPLFEKGWQQEKIDAIVGNALLVALYKAKRVDEAIKVGEALSQSSAVKPYSPLFYNLAIIYTEKKKDAQRAKEYYQKYIEISGTTDSKLEKKINSLKKGKS